MLYELYTWHASFGAVSEPESWTWFKVTPFPVTRQEILKSMSRLRGYCRCVVRVRREPQKCPYCYGEFGELYSTPQRMSGRAWAHEYREHPGQFVHCNKT